jgi:hypothetical protein
MNINVFKLSCREFFVVILRPRVFFVYEKVSKKNLFFGQIFEVLQVVLNPVLAKPYEVLEDRFSASEN